MDASTALSTRNDAGDVRIAALARGNDVGDDSIVLASGYDVMDTSTALASGNNAVEGMQLSSL